MGRVMMPAVVPPPTHSMVTCRRSLVPSPATTTCWMICRTISFRSALVVVAACQGAGGLEASCAMASRPGVGGGGEVGGEPCDGLPRRRREGLGLRLHKALVLLLQVPLRREGRLPLLGELAGDQAVLGFDQAVVAGGAFCLISRPLQALLPQ